MKAEVFSCTVSDGILAYMHGDFYQIERIVVPELNNLAITIDGNNLYFHENFKINDSCKKKGGIELPDDLVKKAVWFMNLKKELIADFAPHFNKEGT